MKKIYQILHKLGSTSRITNTNLDLSTIEEKRVKWMWFSSKFCEVQDVTHKLYERKRALVNLVGMRREIAMGFFGSQSLRNERVVTSIYRMRARVMSIWSFALG